MPVPGPRTQEGPLPGYRNPEGRMPDLFNHWKRPGPLFWPGRSPGTMFTSLRGNVLAAGQIRRLWKQAVDMIPAQAPFSWTANVNVTSPLQPFGITRALRYMTRSVYVGAGVDNSRYENLHTTVTKKNRYTTITVGAGTRRNRPTVRNRISSFGSRVPTLNRAVSAAETQPVDQASQA